MFIIFRYVKEKKYQNIDIPFILVECIFLSLLLGTRVGLFGFILVVAIYLLVEVVMTLKQKGKISKRFIAGGIALIASVLLVVITIGSTTLQRRKHLRDIEKDIIDANSQQASHVTGSILEMKQKIDSNQLEEGYMGQAEKQSIVDLYEIANQLKVRNNDQRKQQLIYNTVLLKNQGNPIYFLFGNGHVANFRELVLEMEIPAFLLDFGLVRICFLFHAFCHFIFVWCVVYDKE